MMFGKKFRSSQIQKRDYFIQAKEISVRVSHEQNAKKTEARREIERRRIMKEADQ